MKEQIKSLYKLFTALIIASLVQACGGNSENTKEPVYSISADTTAIDFSHEVLQASDEEVAVQVTFDGNGLLVGFAPNAAPHAFVKFRTENVTSNSATVYVSLNGTENLAPTLIDTKLRLSTGDVDQVNLAHHDIDLSILIWQLTTNQSEIVFNGTLGDTAIAAQTLSVTSVDNQWTATSDVDWLVLDNVEGTGNGEISITPDLSALTDAGLSNATITLTEVTSGDTKAIPVELGLDNIYLYANQDAISFVNSANSSTLVATLDVNSNHASQLNWQATTTVDWLTLSANNDTNQLTVNVIPESLPEGDWHQATIEVAATENDKVITDTIAVSVYNTANELVSTTVSAITVNDNAIASTATQPHIFVGKANSIDVYHKYTHELLASHVVSPEGTLVEQFIVHPTGSHLLAKAVETVTDEQGNETQVTHRYKITLDDFTVETLDAVTIDFEPVRYISIAGRYFVVTQLLELADESLVQQFWDANNAFFSSSIDVANSVSTLYALNTNSATINRFSFIVNDFTSERVSMSNTHQYRPELLGDGELVRSLVVDANETNIYANSPTSEWISFDGETFSDNGLLPQADESTTIDVLKSNDNNTYYIRFNPTEGFVIDVYDNSQSQVSSTATGGPQPSQALLTEDSKLMVLYSAGAQVLQLIAL
ncbi:hypothetical protein [Thalassotalea fusca]